MPSDTIITTAPSVVVGPPQVDLFSFFANIYDHVIGWGPALFGGAKSVFGIIVGLSIVLSFFFIIGIIYCIEQLKHIRSKEKLMYDTKTEPAYQAVAGEGDAALTHRWENVIRHIESTNQNDWKQAILEADMMLDDILTSMGYRGESVGEKLKRVVKGDFATLNEAWEAHKVRNDIAHTPNFNLTQHIALATVNLYKKVFEEFFYI